MALYKLLYEEMEDLLRMAKEHRERDELQQAQIYEKYLAELLNHLGGEVNSEVKTDVPNDRVHVFTPNGELIDLPVGSTPIDFAYAIHTDLGHLCRGANVNGQLVALDTKLREGDRVTIIAAKRGGPNPDWLNPDLGFVATKRARLKIRSWLSEQGVEVGTVANLAKCCNPVPGDRIVGYIAEDDELGDVAVATIHRQGCPEIIRLLAQNRGKLIDVVWKTPKEESTISATLGQAESTSDRFVADPITKEE